MGTAADGNPYAELWMGTHPGAPSRVILPHGEINLGDITADPLPFLFKLLAVEKPLSIQAHPNLAQAREGFERENREGLAQDAPNRNYRDPNHKPEILCALTPCAGMCGFRTPEEIRRLLAVFSVAPSPLREALTPLLRALEISDPAEALRGFFGELFALSPELRKTLTEFILSADDLYPHRPLSLLKQTCLSSNSDPQRGSQHANLNQETQLDAVLSPVAPLPEWQLMRQFARLYPCDPAIIAPLYLNVFHLEPGEAVFLKAGLLHAYIHGFAVELMANSDNVLRGGLTPKHIDIPELMKVLDFNPVKLQIMKPDPEFCCFTYPAPCEEFSLTMIRGMGQSGPAVLDRNAPSICIVTKGEVSVGGIMLKRGESAFIPSGKEPLVLRGDFTIYAAFCHAVPQ
jgi:mannose-6-phosphate isomerase